MDAIEVFVKDFNNESILFHVFSPVVFIFCSVTLMSGLVIMPVIGPRITSNYHQLKERKKSFDTLLGSNIHHIIVSVLAFYAFISGALDNRIISNSALGFALMQASLGYFIGDTILMLYNPKMRYNPLFMYHHFMGITGYIIGLAAKGKGMFFPVSYQLVEISTVFINIHRGMLMAKVSKESHAYKIISHIMVITYIFARLLTIPWQWYEFILFLLDPASQAFPLHFKVYTAVHFVSVHFLFLYWFPPLFRKAYCKRIKDKNM